MDADVIKSTPKFRHRVIAVLLYTDWMARYGPVIQSAYFPTDAEKDLVIAINEYHSDYHAVPDIEEVTHIIQENEDALECLERVRRASGNGLLYAADVAMDFAQVQAMKLAILESVDSIADGDLIKPLELVRDAQAIGTDRLELGMDLVDDAESWVYEEQHGKRYPTGIAPIDNILGGGLVGGEYGLVMAPPGGGKSTVLINIGFGMAGLVGNVNVLNLTYEMPAQKYLKRYAARVAGIRLKRGDGAERVFIKSLRKRAKQRLRGKLRVVRPTEYTVDAIRRLIDNLSAEGWDTEALIVDYPDLMRPTRRRQELRFELADIARELRELGHEYDMPVWGGTQAGRHAFYKEIITTADIAEAVEKAAIADIVISLCQTREEESLGQARLYMAKIRDAEDRFAIPVKVNFKNQTITPRRALDALVS